MGNADETPVFFDMPTNPTVDANDQNQHVLKHHNTKN
jgi:hypothetical protein